MAASLLGLGLMLGGGHALAQQPASAPPSVATPTTLSFTKEPGAPRFGDPSAAVPTLSFTKEANTSGLPVVPGPQSQPVPDAPNQPYVQNPGTPPAGTAPPAPRPTFGTLPQAQAPVRGPALPAAPYYSAPAPVYSAPAPVYSAPSVSQPVAQPMPWPDTPIIQRAAMMQKQPDGKKAEPSMRAPTETTEEYQIQLEPPGPQRLFKLESEAQFFERLRQEARQRPTPERIDFPDEPVLSKQQVFAGRYFPPMVESVEPSYVCYGRLYFEDKNFDRYGWDLGFIQPFVSAGLFYWDVATLPYHMFTDPCRHCECNAGYCLPGDPVPFLLYPPGLSVTGLLAETGAVVALPFLMP